MTKTLLLLIGLALAGVAQAQIKCWTGADGKRACGDAPPAGAKTTTIMTPPPAPAAPAAAGGKAGSKGPLTAAEREQEYRKRQLEEKKAMAKAEKEKDAAELKRDNCERAKEAVVSLESGQRIQRIDAKGERYFMDDSQREQETAKARLVAKQSCG